ncbi:hypothetical protein BCVP_CDS0084 [Bacillus phage BC-VP]|nr:hypothetical protein BCVP_CDS0084 [Bacillus phage BC-VP]
MNTMYVWHILHKHGDELKRVKLNGINPHTVIETLQRIQYDKSKRIVIFSVAAIGHINKSSGKVVLFPLTYRAQKIK